MYIYFARIPELMNQHTHAHTYTRSDY